MVFDLITIGHFAASLIPKLTDLPPVISVYFFLRFLLRPGLQMHSIRRSTC